MNKVFIIAEAGVNHNGSLELAKKLVDVAVDAKADAVKFQTFKADKLVCKSASKAEYQKEATDRDESQFDMLKKLELDLAAHEELIEYCKQKNIMFLSTPFGFDSIDMLIKLNIDIFKVPSGEVNNLPFLRKIGGLGKKVIISTGMTNLGEIETALDIVMEAGTEKNNITVLHCNTEYPSPMEDVNLRAMQTIKDAFKVNIGYSDHTPGIEVPVAAVALGASVIEKHFTLDKNMPGPDHLASLDPSELKEMVRSIRNIEIAMGNGIKKPSQSELKNKVIARKSIVAAKNIKVGDLFSEDNITVKRPGNGISPLLWDKIIGLQARLDFVVDEAIKIDWPLI
jgi:N,N'-diacetyllegionaminate synthase